MGTALLSRVAGIIFTPSNFLILLLVLGLVLQWTRYRRSGKGLVIAVTVLFLLIFFLPLDEWWARRWRTVSRARLGRLMSMA